MGEALDKGSGQVVFIPDDEMGEAWASGRYKFKPGTRIPVKNDEGEVGTVPAEAVKGTGWQLATGEELQHQRKTDSWTTAGAQVQATLEGGARGLTFGGSDHALKALGMDAEDIRGRQESNPELAIGGEVVTGLAPLLLSGGSTAGVQGAGLLARGAGAVRTAGVLPRAVGSAGLATERAVARALGDGIIARTAGATAGGALEAGVAGAGHVVSQAALNEDVELTIETLMAGAGEGALLGGGFGGALGAAGAVATRAGRVAADQLGGVLGAGAGLRQRFLPKVAAAEDAAEIARAKKFESDDFAQKIGESRDRAAKEIEADIDGNLARGDRLMHEQSIARKANEWRQAIIDTPPQSTMEEVATAARRQLAQADRLANEVIDGRIVADQVEVSAAKAFQKDMVSRHAAVDDAIVKRDMGGVMAEMDGIKRRLGNLVRTPEGSPGQGLATRARTNYMQLRDELVDGSLWGTRAVEMQVGENAAFAKMLTAQDNPFVRRMFQASGLARGADGFQPMQVIKADKLKQLVEAEVDDKGLAAAQQYFRGHAELQKELAGRAGATAAQKKVAAESVDAAMRIEKQLNDLAGQNAFARSLSDEAKRLGLKAEDLDIRAQDQSAVAKVATAALSSSALAGGFMGLFTPGVSVALAGLPQAARIVRMASRSKGLQGKVTAAGRMAVEGVTGAGRAVRRVAPQAAARVGTREERFNEALRDVSERSTRAARDIENVARDTEDLERSVKGAQAAAIHLQARATEFLASKLPKGYMTMPGLQSHLDELDRVPDSEKARFLRYYETVRDPMTAIERIGNGKATRQEMEALKAVYPRMFKELQASAIEAIAEAETKVPYSKLANLSLLLGMPLHPSFAGRFIRASQVIYAHEEEEPQEPGAQMASAENPLAPSSRKPLDSEGAAQTGTQGTEARSSAS